MRLLFSEYKSNYENYIFPYAIWAIPDEGESPSIIFAKGFLPVTRSMDRFYMCRHVRIELGKFERSSENRRILRKCEGIKFKLIPRSKFDFTRERREFYKTYADIKFGKDVMTYERLDSLFNSKIISHFLLFVDTAVDKDVGVVTLYLEPKMMAYYYYAFYDLSYYSRNLGMYMMTSAVDYFAQHGYDHIYLGTCYSRNALYKTQFKGAQFYNGFRWEENLEELKYLIKREKYEITCHLLENEDYLQRYYDGDLKSLVQNSDFRMELL